jgi:hypothetical protein
VLRLRAKAFALYDEGGEKINLLEKLDGLEEGEYRSLEARYLHNEEYEAVRICAVRKDHDSERAGLKRLKRENQRKKHGAEVSALQSAYNGYIIVATSLDERVSAAQVLELYRMRWQIELVFKRLKSLFRYNEIPVKQDKTAYAWFYGKLLLAALCERLVNEGRFSGCTGDKKNRKPENRERLSLWRELYIAQSLIIAALIGSLGRINLVEDIQKLPALCASSKRKKIPRLCAFSSA